MVKKIKKKVKKIGFTIKKKILNNKSRKGEYFYIREAGKRPAYYKIKEGVSIDNYLLAYQGKVKVKKKGVIQYTKESPAQKYLKTVGKRKRIDDLIGKGITETTVANLLLTGRKGSHQAYKKMLEPLVKDKELLDIIALEENVNKFKHRIQASITITSSDGVVEIPLKIFNKSLIEIENDFKSILRKKQIMESDVNDMQRKGYKMDGLPKGADITGSKYHILANKLGKIKVRLKFVKAK